MLVKQKKNNSGGSKTDHTLLTANGWSLAEGLVRSKYLLNVICSTDIQTQEIYRVEVVLLVLCVINFLFYQ